jgi:exosome complex RNA-binding protein Rrp4
MREYIKEGDVIVAEVKSVSYSDKTIGLHIRHEKFGKLDSGIVIEVNNCLIKRMKTHFYERHEIEFIFGVNGVIWMAPKSKTFDQGTLEVMAKFRNLFTILNDAFIAIHPELVFEIFAMTSAYKAKDLILPQNKAQVIEFVTKSINAKKSSISG